VRPEQVLRRVAEAQHGVFSRAQVLECGLTDQVISWRLRTRAWERVHPGVYRLCGAPRTWRQAVLAAVLAAGPRAAASHRTAGRLLSLEGVRTSAVEVVTPLSTRPRLRGARLHRSRTLAASDVVCVDGIPQTKPARTLFDLASKLGPLDLEIALDDALRRQLVTVKRMLAYVEHRGRRGRRGAGTLHDFLLDRLPNPPAGSGWETRLRHLLRSAGLPAPLRQHVIRDRRGRFVARVDLAVPDHRVALEFDGYRHHTGRRAWERDARRQRRAEDLGWRFRRFTSGDVRERRAEVVASVRTALRQAGWTSRR
jgi:very-short-patch-repair endonuclease